MMTCPNCQAELPDDAAFCIECGRPVTRGATGPTERLPAGAGPVCTNCGVINPFGAIFCVACGRAFTGTVPAGAPQEGARPVLEREPPRVIIDSAEPRYPLAPAPEPTVIPLPEPVGESRRERKRRRKEERRAAAARRGPDFGGPLFMIGLGILFFTGWFWPGILVLIGLVAALGAIQRGKVGEALQPAVWFIGIAILAQTGLWWPGILILIGLSALFSKIR